MAVLTLILVTAMSACGGRPTSLAEAPAESAAEPATGRAPASIRVIFLGDSLVAGSGLTEDQAFPALVEGELRLRGWPVDVINGGVSGDTTAGGSARLDWLLRQSPDVVVVELGANDGLRGLPIESIAANLRDMVERSKDAGALVLLIGMKIPPNYGAAYAGRFEDIFPQVAAELTVPLMPFLLEGVGGRAELNQADGIHPNAEGHRIVARSVLPHVEALLRQLPVRVQGDT
jgi:acyl-CoA thioesterase-1